MFWDTNNTNIQLKKNYKKKKMQIKQFKSLKQFNTILKKSVIHLILGFYDRNTQSA